MMVNAQTVPVSDRRWGDRQSRPKHLSQARNVKALTNHEYGWRLRVGNYRVFFEFDGAVRIVSIEEVRKRDERTY